MCQHSSLPPGSSAGLLSSQVATSALSHYSCMVLSHLVGSMKEATCLTPSRRSSRTTSPGLKQPWWVGTRAGTRTSSGADGVTSAHGGSDMDVNGGGDGDYGVDAPDTLAADSQKALPRGVWLCTRVILQRARTANCTLLLHDGGGAPSHVPQLDGVSVEALFQVLARLYSAGTTLHWSDPCRSAHGGCMYSYSHGCTRARHPEQNSLSSPKRERCLSSE